MKQIKIIDQGLGQGRPAYDLLIPANWEFKSAVNVNQAEGGCFADWFSVLGDAKSPDNSIELQILPQFTWRYTEDPAGQRQMQIQNQNDAKFGMKPCPVRAPIRSEEYLRKDLVAKCTKVCKNPTVVSAEAFPELAESVRHQLGLRWGVLEAMRAAPALKPHACASRLTTRRGSQPRGGWRQPLWCVRFRPAAAAEHTTGMP
jgi:hypothetical protein